MLELARIVVALVVVLNAAGCGGGQGGGDAPPDTLAPGDTGGEAFRFEEPVALGVPGRGLQVGDLDGDGITDLVIAIGKITQGAPTVLVRSGRADRTLVDAGGYPTTVSPETIVLEDITGDGVTDAVIGSLTGRAITVLPGIAGGTFGPEMLSFADASTRTLLVGAFDAGPTLDAVTGEHRGKQNTVLFAPGNGDGTFAATSEVPLGGNVDPHSGLTADLDADGIPDIGFSDFVDDVVVLYRGNGDGTFTERSRVPIANAGDVAVGELDGDGDLDLVVLAAGRIWAVLGAGDGTFDAPAEFPAGTAIVRLEIGDLDGDGDLDAVAADDFADSFHVLLGRGDGSFGEPISFPLAEILDFAIADLDADGRNDLVVATSEPPDVHVYFGVR